MRRLRVFCWLVAWSLWGAAGYCLYREAPRVFAVRCNLGLNNGIILGVSTDGRSVLTASVHSAPGLRGGSRPYLSQVVFSNVQDGSVIGGWKVDRRSARWCEHLHRLVLGGPPRGNGPPVVLDLENGVERPFACEAPDCDELIVAFHDARPWAVFKGRIERDLKAPPEAGRIVVADMNDGSIIATIPPGDEDLPSDRFYYDVAPFIAGTDLLVVGTISNDGVHQDFQTWRIPAGKKPERSWKGPRHPSFPTIARNGRAVVQVTREDDLAGPDKSEMAFVDVVLDLERGAVLLRRPSPRWDHPLISADGRTLIQAAQRSAWDVDTGRLLWEWEDRVSLIGCDRDSFVQLLDGRGERPMQAWWNLHVARRLPALKVGGSSYSAHDLRTGATLYRSSEPTLTWQDRPLGPISASRTTISREGVVRDLPPSPPWRLIATLQAMLASPLVAIWLWGVWRRRRRRTRAVDA